jgi:hypothetical protein
MMISRSTGFTTVYLAYLNFVCILLKAQTTVNEQMNGGKLCQSWAGISGYRWSLAYLRLRERRTEM